VTLNISGQGVVRHPFRRARAIPEEGRLVQFSQLFCFEFWLLIVRIRSIKADPIYAGTLHQVVDAVFEPRIRDADLR
jgi:hypothetical protein